MNKISIPFTLEEWERIIASLKNHRDFWNDKFGFPKSIEAPEEPIILTIEEKLEKDPT